MSRPALDESSKCFAVLFEALEVFCWVEGGGYAVSYRESSYLRCVFPFAGPDLGGGEFRSSFSIRPCGAEGDLAVEGGGLLTSGKTELLGNLC